MACHAIDKKLVGPSFKEIAAKYKGAGRDGKLIDKVRQGRHGRLRPDPDAAEHGTDDDAKTIADPARRRSS